MDYTADEARKVFAIADELAARIIKADPPAGRERVRIDYDSDGAIYAVDDGKSWGEHYSGSTSFAALVDLAVRAGHLTIVQAVMIKAHAALMRDYMYL